jgi:hypothetical protein
MNVNTDSLRALAALLLVAYVLFTQQWIILVLFLVILIVISFLGGLIG